MVDDKLKQALLNDPRFKFVLANIPEDQHAAYEELVLKFAKQFQRDILLQFAEKKYRATAGDE